MNKRVDFEFPKNENDMIECRLEEEVLVVEDSARGLWWISEEVEYQLRG